MCGMNCYYAIIQRFNGKWFQFRYPVLNNYIFFSDGRGEWARGGSKARGVQMMFVFVFVNHQTGYKYGFLCKQHHSTLHKQSRFPKSIQSLLRIL